MTRNGWTALVVAVLVSLGGAIALAGEVTPAPGNASFVATATAGLRLEGKSSALSAVWDGDTLVVTLPLATLRTGIELRDKHLREHIEADKYPTAELRVPMTALTLPAPGASASGTAQAPLSFHGQVKPVSFHWAAKSANGFDVSGGLQLDFTEFGVPRPSYLGVTVRPPADVSVEFHVGDPRPAR